MWRKKVPDNLTWPKWRLTFLLSSVLELCPLKFIQATTESLGKQCKRGSHHMTLKHFRASLVLKENASFGCSTVPSCTLCYTPSPLFYFMFFFLKQLLGLGRLCKLSACRLSVRFRSSAPLDALTYNPSFREAESGDPLRQAGLTILCIQGLQHTCLSTKVESGGRRRYLKLNSSLYTQAPTHMWTQMRKHVHHTCTHMQKRLNGTYIN